MIGKRFIITGMQLEVISEAGDYWQVENLTTGEMILMDKSMLEKSIKLGKAEEIPGRDD